MTPDLSYTTGREGESTKREDNKWDEKKKKKKLLGLITAAKIQHPSKLHRSQTPSGLICELCKWSMYNFFSNHWPVLDDSH